MLRRLRKKLRRAPPAGGMSYAQCGEDRIVHWMLAMLGVREPRYLDIGAYHPMRLSNTYLFYTLGGSGVLVEPRPAAAAEIRSKRPRDVCLAAGVGPEPRADAPFYVMKSDTLCTFSKQEAERMVAECREEILEVLHLPVLSPREILSRHFEDGLHFVSLDVEGLELDILKAFDLAENRPEVLCVETISYAIDGSGVKDHETIAFVESQGYRALADTYVNTIFVDDRAWQGLGRRARGEE